MSDNWLKFVPANPYFQPAKKDAREARKLLKSFLPDACEVNALFEDEVRFVDAGGNWKGVLCPTCGVDAESWWYDAVSSAYEKQFSNLVTKAPCCGAEMSLNEMHFPWPVAFGSFVLEAKNPNVRGLSQRRTLQLAKILGCKLTTVWQHL